MKTFVTTALLAAGLCSSSLLYAQQNSNDDRYRNDDRNRYDNRSIDDQRDRYDDRRDFQEERYNDQRDIRRERMDNMRDDRRDQERREQQRMDDIMDQRRSYNQRANTLRRYDNPYMSDMDAGDRNRNGYDERDLSKAYDQGFDDGIQSAERSQNKERKSNYQNFAFGIYGGANVTRFAGEDLQGNTLSGRLGYQLGLFVRGGGRVYGQVGVEYLTSSSDISTVNSTTALPSSTTNISYNSITSNVDQQYIHVPVYIGFKLVESDRGVSAVRFQLGAELAAPVKIANIANDNAPGVIKQSNLNPTTFNGLASLGFDAGPIFLSAVYHYGFTDILKEPVQGIVNSQRRILSVNVGVKF